MECRRGENKKGCLGPPVAASPPNTKPGGAGDCPKTYGSAPRLPEIPIAEAVPIEKMEEEVVVVVEVADGFATLAEGFTPPAGRDMKGDILGAGVPV